MNTTITQLPVDVSEVIQQINQAARNMLITAGQRDELLKIVLKDVADKTNLQTARELLAAWS